MRWAKMRGWYFFAEQPAPAPHLTHPKRFAALRIVLVTAPRVSRSCEHFPDGFDLHLLRANMTCSVAKPLIIGWDVLEIDGLQQGPMDHPVVGCSRNPCEVRCAEPDLDDLPPQSTNPAA